VDCLTLWVSNLLLAGADIGAATDALCNAMAGVRGRLILVANEVGYGIVPDNALARRFRDDAGRVNQAVAAIADEVVLVAAGLPLRLK
ncbi:MAG TPA: bifunctional adenosylcobinamide kinase/adenosylcobinamide-phosphate guanylyltransferase, partial [Sphingopyxis sp.]|nr:bifunctional adenosylcobinamide kinase/adenosylcobinamide-phosphate guanylyltransferase [Sphingopyxis sp.]